MDIVFPIQTSTEDPEDWGEGDDDYEDEWGDDAGGDEDEEEDDWGDDEVVEAKVQVHSYYLGHVQSGQKDVSQVAKNQDAGSRNLGSYFSPPLYVSVFT